MTFSIVARDNETGELGVAVQSKFPAVGSLVPWIDLSAGAIATQAFANLEYGRKGLRLLKAGASAKQTLDILIAGDPMADHRQVGIVDTTGQTVSFTGKECYPWAGGLIGDAVAVQGNILVGEEVVNSMIDTYLATQGDLAEKLMRALEAGQKAGGDKRGQQSANLLIYRENGGYGGGSDVYIDVRVDDHPNATEELRRVFELYSLTLLEREDPNDITKLTDELFDRISTRLVDLGFVANKPATKDEQQAVFLQWLHTENFENKVRTDGYVWNSILRYLFDE